MSRHWKKLPFRTVIVSDGSMSSSELQRSFRFVSGELVVKTADDYFEHHEKRGRNALVSYARAHPFGLKLAIFLKESETERCIWCDGDVLFFGDLSKRIEGFTKGRVLVAGRDWCHGYEPMLHAALDWDLTASPPVNAGFLLVEDFPYDEFGLEAKLAATQQGWGWYTEQTLLAYCMQRCSGVYWADSEMIISHEDCQEMVGNPERRGWRGRHYIAPYRDLFWRDSVAGTMRDFLCDRTRKTPESHTSGSKKTSTQMRDR